MKVKITLPDGTSFEGEKEDIRDLLDKTGHTKVGHNYYYSKSKGGLVDVKEMDTNHIKNAMLKAYREWVAALSTESDPVKITKSIVGGPDDTNGFITLFNEFRTRRS